jgi:hypothetical protein
MTAASVTEEGTRFGRWVTTSRSVGVRRLPVRCDCGVERLVSASDLRSGKSASCGCSKVLHGQGRRSGLTPTFSSWLSMFQRCTNNPSYKFFYRYAGRGITVCQRWGDFSMFLADMGERPSMSHTLDRIDNDKGYEPGNCRWATWPQQASNRSNTKLEPHEAAQVAWLIDSGYPSADVQVFFGISKGHVWRLSKGRR